MPKIFALRDRMLEVQQSLTRDENVRGNKQNDDSYGCHSSSKSFFDVESMFGRYTSFSCDAPTTSNFQQQQQQHELSSFEEGKKAFNKLMMMLNITN